MIVFGLAFSCVPSRSVKKRSEASETKTQRARLAAQLTAKQEEVRRIAAHPLWSEAVPPGVYRLSVLADGVEIPLMEIEMPR